MMYRCHKCGQLIISELFSSIINKIKLLPIKYTCGNCNKTFHLPGNG